MRRLIVFLATCGAAACSASTGSHPNERAELQPAVGNSVPRRHADVDLSGAWATGSAGEPAVPRIVLRPPCNFGPALWLIQQIGDTVRAWAIPESHAQGVRASHPLSTVAAAEGRLSGVDLTMSVAGSTLLPQPDSPTTPTGRYMLRYDSTTGHLRGTLNGAAFWAVRQEVVRPEGCVPIP
jgi:hypothetical protein